MSQTLGPLEFGTAPEETLPTFLIGTRGLLFCRVVGSPHIDAEAYARLFAAAPDLLAACKLAIPFLEEERAGVIDTHTVRGGTNEGKLDKDGRAWVAEVDAALIPLRAAIGKATN